MLLSIVLVVAGAVTPSAAHAQTCEFVFSRFLTYSALNFGWSAGLRGCSGDIRQLVESAPTENGPWTATYVDWTEFFNNQVRSHWEYEADLPYGWIRARGEFQGQSKATAAAFNHGGGCPGC
jgi:hypothetical protein